MIFNLFLIKIHIKYNLREVKERVGVKCFVEFKLDFNCLGQSGKLVVVVTKQFIRFNYNVKLKGTLLKSKLSSLRQAQAPVGLPTN